jgi:hypothetical protein
LSVEPKLPPIHGKGSFSSCNKGLPPLGFFIHWNLSYVQPRARTRYLQSSIDLSTRCISWGMLLAMNSC